MKTSEQIAREFSEELLLLLAKYSASIRLDIDGNACADIIVDIDGKYDGNGETISQDAELNFGSCLFSDEVNPFTLKKYR